MTKLKKLTFKTEHSILFNLDGGLNKIYNCKIL